LVGEAPRNWFGKRAIASGDSRRCPHLQNLRTIARLLALLGLMATSLIAPWVDASALEQSSNADPAANAEPDRRKLIEAANAEGAVTVYSSVTVEDMAVLTAAFERKYGIKVRVWRGSSENIVQRSVVEARGGRFDVDVVETGATAMEALHREMLLREVKTSAAADLIPAAITPHREWIGTRFNIFAAAYNTRLIKKDELPKSYHDLLDRKWKGKLGVESEDSDWFGAVVGELGEDKGLELFREIVATNGISVRKGHTLLANLVVSGEVPLALTAYAYKAEQLKNGGAPLDWLIIPPGMARFEGVGVARRAPHPNGAFLFLEFMLTDAQELLLNRDFFPASRKVRTLPNGLSVTFLDPVKALDENQKWSKYYRDIVTNQAR
jgi:iron(III) transport system substrate-binding protein